MSDLPLFHLTRPPVKSSDGPPPALVLLHGFGSSEQDLFGLADALDPRLFVVSVRAPLALGPGQFAWYRLNWTADGPVPVDPGESETSLQTLRQFLTSLPAAYGIDSNRLFLGGFSQGAIMSLAVALTQPQIVAGAVIMSGRVLPGLVPGPGPYPPLFVAHGLYDSVLTIAEGRAVQELLQARQAEFTYREYPMAHEISLESWNDAVSWLAERLAAHV